MRLPLKIRRLLHRVPVFWNLVLGRKYGVYDTQDDCWIGNDDGPVSYTDRLLAQVMSQICSDRVTGSDLSMRFVVKRLPGGPWHWKDEVPTERSTLESIKRLEGQ